MSFPWWFTSAPQSGVPLLEELVERSSLRHHLSALTVSFGAYRRSLLRDPGAATIGLLGASPATTSDWLGIGIGGRAGSGFRGSDGSRRYESFVARTLAASLFEDPENTLERIANGSNRFEPLVRPRPESVEALSRFLRLAERHDEVVGLFLVPLASTTRAAMRASPKHADYVETYRAVVESVVGEYDVALVDAVDPSIWGLDDRAFIDGFHGSEVVMTRVLLEWLAHPRIAEALVSLKPSIVRGLLDDPATTPGYLGITGPNN